MFLFFISIRYINRHNIYRSTMYICMNNFFLYFNSKEELLSIIFMKIITPGEDIYQVFINFVNKSDLLL